MDPNKVSGLMKDFQKESNNDEEDEQWSAQEASPQNNPSNAPNLNLSKQPQHFDHYPSMSNNVLPMTNMNMSNIDNLSINIINQYQTPLPYEETQQSLNPKLNVNNSNKKSVAFDYYFGKGQGGNSDLPQKQTQLQPLQFQGQQKPGVAQEIIGQGLNKGQGKMNYSKQSFIPQQNKLNQQGIYKGQNSFPGNINMNMAMTMPMSMDNQNSYFPQGKINRDNRDSRDNKDNNPMANYDQMVFMQQNQHQYQQQKHSFHNKLDMNDQMYKKSTYNNNPSIGRFFVIKSSDDDNIIKAIDHHIWCSTIKGNQKLQKAYKDADGKFPIYLFFSVNGSGKFMGLARMGSDVDYKINFNHWSQSDKWKGYFRIDWLFIKDVPNRVFRNIINELNDNKPVTSSRDTQEIYPHAGAAMLKVFKEHMPAESSFLNDMIPEDKIAISMGNMSLNHLNQMPLSQQMEIGHNQGAFKGMLYQGGNNNNMQNMKMMQGRPQQQHGGGYMKGINNNPQYFMQNNQYNQQFQEQMNQKGKEGNFGRQEQQPQPRQFYGANPFGRSNHNNDKEDDNDINDHFNVQEEPKIPFRKIIQNPNKLQQQQQQQLIKQQQKQQQKQQHQLLQQQKHQEQMAQFNQGSFPQFLNNNLNPKGFEISQINDHQSMLPFQMGNIPLRNANNDNEDDDNDEEDDEEEETDYNKINLANEKQNQNQLFFNPKPDSDSDK